MRAASETGLYLEETVGSGIEDVLDKVYDVFVSFQCIVPADTIIFSYTLGTKIGDIELLDLSTKQTTTISLNISSSEIILHFSPYLYFVIPVYKNQIVKELRYNFHDKGINFELSNDGWLGVNLPTAYKILTKQIFDAYIRVNLIKGTKLDTQDYNPEKDVNLTDTLIKLLRNFQNAS